MEWRTEYRRLGAVAVAETVIGDMTVTIQRFDPGVMDPTLHFAFDVTFSDGSTYAPPLWLSTWDEVEIHLGNLQHVSDRVTRELARRRVLLARTRLLLTRASSAQDTVMELARPRSSALWIVESVMKETAMKTRPNPMRKHFLRLVAKEERGPNFHRYLRKIKGL